MSQLIRFFLVTSSRHHIMISFGQRDANPGVEIRFGGQGESQKVKNFLIFFKKIIQQRSVKPGTFLDMLKSLLSDVSEDTISSKRGLTIKLEHYFGHFGKVGNTTKKHSCVCLGGFITRKNQLHIAKKQASVHYRTNFRINTRALLKGSSGFLEQYTRCPNLKLSLKLNFLTCLLQFLEHTHLKISGNSISHFQKQCIFREYKFKGVHKNKIGCNFQPIICKNLVILKPRTAKSIVGLQQK